MPSELRVDKVSSTTSPYTPVFSTTGGALSHRNLIINGAMQVAQRGTSSTVDGYGTVDRFKTNLAGNDENPTQAQHVLTSSDTGPYEEGFRYSYHLTNGNQTSGANAGDRIVFGYTIEAQDMAMSGWDYTSSSSYITLSFWCKSSVAQNFYGRLYTYDGTPQGYAFETGSLSANTWTKVTKTIPGNSNLTFDKNTNAGLLIEFVMFRGTNSTGSMSLDTWGAFDTNVRVPDMTSTWYTTNDATWEITGLQLERGSVATPFEHRRYADELLSCYRYYVQFDSNNRSYDLIFPAMVIDADDANTIYEPIVPMNHSPDVIKSNVSKICIRAGGINAQYAPVNMNAILDWGNRIFFNLDIDTNSLTAGQIVYLAFLDSTTGEYFALDAEL